MQREKSVDKELIEILDKWSLLKEIMYPCWGFHPPEKQCWTGHKRWLKPSSLDSNEISIYWKTKIEMVLCKTLNKISINGKENILLSRNIFILYLCVQSTLCSRDR